MRLPIAALEGWLSPVPPAHEVARTLTAVGFEVEGRGETVAGTVLEINVPPNRGDGLSVRGLARELCAALDRPFRDPAPPPLPPALAESSRAISLPDPRCPRFLGVEIRGVKAGVTPTAVQRLLEAFGMRPVSPPVDAANLVMLELGQPLHTYDLKSLRGGITVRGARAGETLVTLDGQKRDLSPWPVKGQSFAPLLICDDRDGMRAIGLAGVMGGGETEIAGPCAELYLEAAAFDPIAVRRTAKKFALHSEASHRFERGVDPQLPKLAAARFLELLGEWGCGGTVAGWRLVETVRPGRRAVELRPAALKRLLGAELPEEFVAGRFAALGLERLDGGRWGIPSWRADLALEEDLIEEAGRHFGYDRIGETLPAGIDPAPGRTVEQQRAEDVRARAIASGFTELISIPFSRPQTPADDIVCRGEPVRIANPIWLDQPELAHDYRDAILRVAEHNLRPETYAANPRQVRLFELRGVYGQGPEGQVIRNDSPELVLFCAYPGDCTMQEAALDLRDSARTVYDPDLRCDWSRQPLAGQRGIAFKARTLGDEMIRCRLIHSSTVPYFDHARSFWLGVAEASLGNRAWRARTESPPRFPEIERDLNFLVPNQVLFADLRAGAMNSGCVWLESVNNLDFGFTGKGIPEGHRALAVRFTFRNAEDTLTAEEAEADLAKIRAALEKIGVRVRA